MVQVLKGEEKRSGIICELSFNFKEHNSIMENAKYTERSSWPGMLLTPAQWQWFDCQDGETKRDYYRFMTKEERVEA